MAITGAAVAYSAVGGLVLYSGIKGATLADTAKAVLAGNLTVTGSQPIDFSPGNITSSGLPGVGGAGSGPALQSGATAPASGGSGSVASGSAGAAQAYAQSQLSKYGWSSAQFGFLQELWNRESGWSNTIWNGGSHAATLPAGSSGAYGIAQSLPYTKYPKAGWPPGYGGSADAQAQINWGLQYIRGRYGSPELAWAHEVANSWY